MRQANHYNDGMNATGSHILNTIASPADLQDLSEPDLARVADEIRALIIQRCARVGGHLGSNLGVVEATLALHRVFSSPRDKLIFDVSHQTYAHKILTGRADTFKHPNLTAASSFMSSQESEHDPFTLGHTSTSVSLAAGLALARDAQHEDYRVVAIIGDGALSGGEALEGLNFAATLKSNLIIVINDNNNSIAANVGGLYQNLAELRAHKGAVSQNLFELLGFEYRFVEHGNDLGELEQAFAEVRECNHPVVVHIVTQKGCGYEPAETHPEQFHSIPPFSESDPESAPWATPAYGPLFADWMLKQFSQDNASFVINAATPAAVGFTPDKRALAGKHFIDVGIAEQTATSLAAGMARAGARPTLAIQATFLQRAYDQLAQEIALDSSPATLVVFNSSIYDAHDMTHQGRLDIPMLSSIPGFVYLAPYSQEEFFSALAWAQQQTDHPVGIKVPGGDPVSCGPSHICWDNIGEYDVVELRSKVAILGLGTFLELAREVADECGATLINPLYASSVDEELLTTLASSHDVFVTIEDGYLAGGFGEKVAAYLAGLGKKCLCYGIASEFRNRYIVEDELKRNRLTKGQILSDIQSVLN